MKEKLGFATCLGTKLRLEVEQQLLDDLSMYGVDTANCKIDWSATCPEGHRTQYLNGYLENWSDVNVVSDGNLIAQGWIDFIHGGGDNPLFVFWDNLSIIRNQISERAKERPGIPKHIWERLPNSSRELCAVTGKYDSNWSKDPLVLEWKQKQSW